MTQPKALLTTAVLLSAAALLTQACGPSIRRTHQSDNAFERCFDMDYRPASTPSEKDACWTTWLKSAPFEHDAEDLVLVPEPNG